MGGPASRLVDGRFELLDCLGGGGMGLVWRARDTALQRDVALKEVLSTSNPAGQGDSVGANEMRQRVLREARALAQLRHPNVVIIHHIVDSPEHPNPWLVMELVTGGSLADRLAKGRLTVPEAVRIGRGVLSALRAAHAVGILHRDVKPGNVLLRPDGSPVLTDFGIAAVRDATALTVSGSVIGSPEYIAPERLRGYEGNPSSDLWSLAMMLYVAVEGRHPLRRATMLATLAAVLDEPLPPPVHAGPLTPALSAMLARDPRLRPDATEFDRLLAAAEQPQIWPAPTTVGIPVAPPPSRRRRRVALVAVTAAVLVIAGVLAWTLIPRTTDTGGTPSASGGTAPTTTLIAAPKLTTPHAGPVTPATPGDLLTPAGVRATIAAMHLGPKVLQLTIYTNHASAEAPTTADPHLYDDVDYNDGAVTHSPGGTIDSSDTLIDLSSINWDLLPTLLRKADATLNVPHPTIIYIIVDTDTSFTDAGDPVTTTIMRIYRADDYGGGYLAVDLKGNVLRTVPRS